jgi:hypothetical protein
LRNKVVFAADLQAPFRSLYGGYAYQQKIERENQIRKISRSKAGGGIKVGEGERNRKGEADEKLN